MIRLGFILTMLFMALVAAPTTLAAPLVQEGGRDTLPLIWWLTPVGSAIALIFAYVLYAR